MAEFDSTYVQPWMGSAILLVDLDAFFASVEQLDHPAWRGKPVIVGGDADKHGVVSTASYEARAYGVHSAMPASAARELCPQAIWTHGHFDRYKEILERYDVPKGSIEIELTESLFLNEISTMTDLVNKIHEVGLRCSIDDFGSGYSSLNMLKDIKVDALKLDRVFFIKTEEDKRGKDIINSILHLAQNLHLQTISEGVEIRSQVEYLKEMDCDYIQGYVFAKPMPVKDFVKIAFAKSV